MTSPLTYTIGTVTLEHGSAEIEGNGTSWQLSGVRGGVMTVEVAGGNPLVLDTVEDDAIALAATKWMGPSGTYNYAISLASADAAETVWASRHWSRVVGGALLSAIPFKASGTAAERDALNPPLENGEWFGLAETAADEIIAQLKVPGGWRDFTTRGVAGVGEGGLGLPSPGAANKMPFFTGPDTVSLTDLTAFARTLLGRADSPATARIELNLGRFLTPYEFGAIGDGEANDTAAFQAMFDAAALAGVSAYIPSGRYLLSAPVNARSVSLFGEDRKRSIILADPATPYAEWKITSYDNDVALIYSINSENWVVRELGFDCQDAYTKAVTSFGATRAVFQDCDSRRSASCSFQFMGSRASGHNPVIDSIMIGCYGEGARWNFVIDGEAYNCSIIGNISREATNRHISLDPQEADAGTKEQRGIIVTGNQCIGRRTAPEDWYKPETAKPSGAIGTKDGFWGIVTNNYIREWSSVGSGDTNLVEAYGLHIRGGGGVWSGNVIHNAPGASPGERMQAGIRIQDAKSDLLVTGNAVYGAIESVRWDGLARVKITGNEIRTPVNVTGPIQSRDNVEIDPYPRIGSNANGHWERYSNGVQVCRSPVFTVDMTTAAGALFRSEVQEWIYPVGGWVEGPPMVTGCNEGSATSHWTITRALSNSAQLVAMGPASTTGRSIKGRAEGRWF